MVLKALDDRLLERALPPAIFYNLLVSAAVPAGAAAAAATPQAALPAAAL
jgi:hypothetical protein